MGATVTGLRPTEPGTADRAVVLRPASAARSVLRQAEREALRTALAAHPGDRRALAARLGISLRTLYRKLDALRHDA